MPTGIGGEKLWLCPTLDDSANDLSGNSNNGTYNGGMGTVADTSNGGTKAYSFTSDDFIDVSGLDLGGLNKFTWSAWIYDDYPYWAYQHHNGMFSHRFASNGFTDEIYFFSRTTSSIYFQVNNGADGSEVYGSNYQSWIHACIVYDGTQASSNDRIKYYVNGTLQTYTSTFSVPASLATTTVTPVTRIGHYASVATTDSVHYFNGKQDDIRVFDRALSTSEITHLATSRGIEGSPYTYSGLGDEKLWLCPSLDDSADDISGNGNHGTYNGGMGTVADTSNGGTRAYSFDGLDDRVDFGDILDTEVWTSGRWTVSQWIYPQNSQYNWFLGKYINSSQQQFITNARDQGNGLRGGAVIYGSLTSQVWRGFEGTTNLSLNQWYHLVVEYDSSQAADDQVRIWLDGTEETINIWTSQGTVSNIQDGSQTLRLNGLINGNSTFHKPSRQDDIRVFDRALSTSEITSLASKRGYEVPAASSGSTPHPLSAPIFHPLG